MAGESMTIRELSGSEREVELRDRALPHRPVSWPREQRVKRTAYPGNPVATVQILGPDDRPLEMGGVWHARYVGVAVTLTGFDDLWAEGDPITPELLVAVFDRLLRAGNLLEVSWGPEVRRGVLRAFEPSYQRVEDVEWKLTFEWTQAGDFTAPRASPAEDPQHDLDEALAGLEDAMSRMPAIILPNLTTSLLAAELAAREALLALSVSVSSAAQLAEVTMSDFQGVATLATATVEAGRAVVALAADSSIEELVATEDVATLLEAVPWASELTAAAREVIASAIQAREAIRARVVEDLVETIRLGQSQTLRSVALARYGSADAWTFIADANGLIGSNVPPGTVLRMPRRASAG